MFLIAVLFLLVSNYGATLAAKNMLPTGERLAFENQDSSSYWRNSPIFEKVDDLKCYVFIALGILGIVLLTQLRDRMEDTGFALGLAGSQLLISGVIGFAWKQTTEIKFVVALVALAAIICLFYKYKDFIVGEPEPVEKGKRT
ncbi:MAG: hypothetical protein V1708_06475 [Candidatus Micrarchaeota archaeon]